MMFEFSIRYKVNGDVPSDVLASVISRNLMAVVNGSRDSIIGWGDGVNSVDVVFRDIVSSDYKS